MARNRKSLGAPRRKDRAEWQTWLWNLPEEFVSRTQKLQFMLMLESTFNNFDAITVVRDLLKARDLWTGALMMNGYPAIDSTRTDLCRLSSDLLALRDLAPGLWNADTLFILTDMEKEPLWRPIVKTWKADEVRFLEDVESGQLLGSLGPLENRQVLMVWWD